MAEMTFAPDYAIQPGETLTEVLEDSCMTQAELARRTGLSEKHISQVATGQSAISTDVAMRLEKATRVPARTWNNLESRYQERLAVIEESERLQTEVDVLEELPVAAMVRLGLLTKRLNKTDRLREVYRFFGVTNRDTLQDTWSATMASFRKSRSYESDDWAVAVWLRMGELRAIELRTRPFDATTFNSALEAARSLTRDPEPRSWLPKLVDSCADAGVALVVVPEVSGARTHGATRWLAPNRALIQLSLRYRWSDIFWFSFFHETKHVLDQAKRSIVLDGRTGSSQTSEEESAANQFAADFLIPPHRMAELKNLSSSADVSGFASELGIHPGIVVGRLQHEQIWPHNRGAGLRQRLEFAEA